VQRIGLRLQFRLWDGVADCIAPKRSHDEIEMKKGRGTQVRDEQIGPLLRTPIEQVGFAD